MKRGTSAIAVATIAHPAGYEGTLQHACGGDEITLITLGEPLVWKDKSKADQETTRECELVYVFEYIYFMELNMLHNITT